MRKLFALLLAVLCLATTAGASAPTPEASASGELRAMALSVKPGDIGLTRKSFGQEAWGIVMETEMDGGYYTLVVLGDGTTSLYFSKGGGIIGAGEHETVRRAGARFMARVPAPRQPAAWARDGMRFPRFFAARTA